MGSTNFFGSFPPCFVFVSFFRNFSKVWRKGIWVGIISSFCHFYLRSVNNFWNHMHRSFDFEKIRHLEVLTPESPFSSVVHTSRSWIWKRNCLPRLPLGTWSPHSLPSAWFQRWRILRVCWEAGGCHWFKSRPRRAAPPPPFSPSSLLHSLVPSITQRRTGKAGYWQLGKRAQ